MGDDLDALSLQRMPVDLCVEYLRLYPSYCPSSLGARGVGRLVCSHTAPCAQWWRAIRILCTCLDSYVIETTTEFCSEKVYREVWC